LNNIKEENILYNVNARVIIVIPSVWERKKGHGMNYAELHNYINPY
jgi:hypothetical protein